MSSISNAIDELREALHKIGAGGAVRDAFNRVASCLVHLNSSPHSTQTIRKLCIVLRQPLLPLYNACLQPTLQLSSSVLSAVLEKLRDVQNFEDDELREAWDTTAKVVLSGILDFLDHRYVDKAESDAVAWKALCRVICEFFFLNSGSPVFSIPLCLSAYNTLTETAVRHIDIQNFLRHRAGLGGVRLGVAISKTREYLPLEALLTLFARLLPPIHNVPQGKLKRAEFVREVLGFPRLFKCNEELLGIMQNTSGMDWDDVAARIIDALAKSDITYPQPFSVDQIDVCGRVFPQPLATDRLIMDKQAFLANIVVENNDLCESLQVPYSKIRRITLDNSGQNIPKGNVQIMVYLTSPPLVANTEMKPLDGSSLHAKFLLQDNTVGRFMEALRRRGVGKLSFLNPQTGGQRGKKSVSIGSGFKFTNDGSPISPTATFEGKIQHVSQVYRTDVEDSTTSEAVPAYHIGSGRLWSTRSPKSESKSESLFPGVDESEMAKDVSTKSKTTNSFSEKSAFVENLALFSSPIRGNSARTKQTPSDNDKLSEISEFEPDNGAVNERVATRGPKLRQTRRMMHCMPTNEGPSVMVQEVEKSTSFGSVSEIGNHTRGVAQKAPETGKSLPTPDSPIFGSSSSTQINASPKLLSNLDIPVTMVGTATAEGSFVEPGTNVCDASDTETPVSLAVRTQTGCNMTENEPGRRAGYFSPLTDVNRNVCSRIDATKDPNPPSKLAGNRRKRETVKSSGKLTVDDEEFTPPRKKSRGGKKDKVKVNDNSSVPRARRSAKTAKLPSPADIGPTIGLDELSELKSSCPGTRKSSRTKKRPMMATRATRACVVHGRKGKQVDTRTAYDIEHRVLAPDSLQDIGAKFSRGTPSPPNSPLAPTPSGESLSSKSNIHEPLVEPSIIEKSPLKTSSMSKTSTDFPREASQPRDTPVIMPRGDGNIDDDQQALSDVIKPIEQGHVKTDGSTNNQEVLSGLGTVGNDVGRAYDDVRRSESPAELSRPVTESTPRKKIIAIDLTLDDSPAREKGGPHKISVDSVRSTTVAQTQHNQSECIEEPTFVPSPRHGRRSVTFASPIEYVLDKNANSKMHVVPLGSPLPLRNNTLSPPRTSTRLKGNQSPYMATVTKSETHAKTSVGSQVADNTEIQDIVDVLNEIHAVIIKGVSDRFRNNKKDIQYGRDGLIQQVLDELQVMVVENAKYFNGLVRLEEDYYKKGEAITRCWEDLINCNDGTAVRFQDALKEHDKNMSARRFPKSLLPLQPVFASRRANAW